MKKLLPAVALIAAAWLGWNQVNAPDDAAIGEDWNGEAGSYTKYVSGEQVEGQGVVVRILPDDTEGSRHQRFILRLATGRTLLVAHNIDLAPRLPSLREGDTVAFYGEFEPNSKGGVVHWTHDDPDGRHPAGWLKYDGKVYQ